MHRAGEKFTGAAFGAIHNMAKHSEIFIVVGYKILAEEISHSQMRENIVSGLISRAVIGAHTALNAACFCSVDH